jgi:hypothetical protein
MPTPENPEIVGTGLDGISPFTKITINQELPEEAFDSRKVREERVEVEAFHLYPPAMEEITGLFGGQP